MKERADKLLVSLGVMVVKPSQVLSADDAIQAQPAHPYVSRGGLKLAHALDVFGVDPSGRDCLDIGASTGGFTDVLVRAGAAHVTAVDVGHGQFHASLQGHPRITSLEGRDARALTAADLPAPPGLLVCDASFISLEKLLDVPLGLAAPTAEFVGLFKPQFQVGRAHIGKGGLVTDTKATEQAAAAFSQWMKEKGWPIHAWTASPISGGDGNAERLFHARRT